MRMNINVIKIITFSILILILSGCNEQKLLENLTQEQATQVLAILQQHNIAATKSGNLKGGYAIEVEKSETTTALSIIQQYQLPWSTNVQIGQAFPDDSMAASPNAEQTKVQSLQEQRLEQSLKIITQVTNAKVHISYPPFNANIDNKKSTGRRVGVLISYKDELDTAMFISQIKSLIRNSLDDVLYENITVALFPAPNISYTTPVKESKTPVILLIVMLIGCILIIVIMSGFWLYKNQLRKNENRFQE